MTGPIYRSIKHAPVGFRENGTITIISFRLVPAPASSPTSWILPGYLFSVCTRLASYPLITILKKSSFVNTGRIRIPNWLQNKSINCSSDFICTVIVEQDLQLAGYILFMTRILEILFLTRWHSLTLLLSGFSNLKF
jgi:hypothetical protein